MTKTMKKSMLAGLVAATLLTAGFALNTQSVDADSTCVLTIRTGASVRIGGESGTGIRFTADIPTAYVKEVVDGETTTYEVDYSKGITEMGMIVVPSFTLEGLEEGENVFDHLQADWNAPKNEVSSMLTKVYKDENADTYYVAGAIIDLQDVNIDETYQAIPYTYDGTDYTFGDASDERTIHQVFNAALEQETDAAKRDKLLNKVVEMQEKLDFGDIRISNFDGADLSKFAGSAGTEWAIATAGVGAYTGASDDGETLSSLALPWEATLNEEAQNFTITYANDKTLTFPAQVWMKEINDVNDLLMFDHVSGRMTNTTNTDKYGTALLDIKGGYFGLTNDITCNINTTIYVRWLSASERLIFDGNGHTIYNFWGNLMHETRATFKDINFVNAKARDCRGLLALHLIGGTTVENVNMDVLLENYAGSAAICANAINGVVSMENVNVVVKNGYAANVNYANGCRQGVIAGRVLDNGSGKFALTNCTFVSDNVDGSLPLLGISSETAYVQPTETANAAYANAISGTYKNYAYNQLGQAELDLTDETKSTASFRKFVADNNLTSGWGPLNVTLTAVSDMDDLAAMVQLTDGYWYLTNNIVWDESKWETDGEVNTREITTTGVLDGNGFAIDGMTDYLFRGFAGVCQNIAFTNIKGSMGSISHRAQPGITLKNVFFHGDVKEDNNSTDSTVTAGLIVGASTSAFTAKDVVVYTTNTVTQNSYRGSIAGLTHETSTLTGDNLVVISAMNPICKYLGGITDPANTAWRVEEEVATYLTGDCYSYANQESFETGYQGTLSAQNLGYYQKLVNANYGVANA
ncbi:MAG: hypothetical protein IJA89_07620 [Clostridia bacterium]|nr:hypothetical protein [Clostridia bacterium]